MEPTIYKPSIYNGAGIYKTGAEGGGGGGGVIDKTIFSMMYDSEEYREIIFDEEIEKDNLSILCSFASLGNSISRILKLYDKLNNQIGQLYTNDSISVFVNNDTGSNGDEISLVQTPSTIIMRNNSYRIYKAGSTLDRSCPWSNNKIKKIAFGVGCYIHRFALYKGGIDITSNSEFIVDLRPCIQENKQGMKDLVSGNFYEISSVHVY